MSRWRAWLFAGFVIAVIVSLGLATGMLMYLPVGGERWLNSFHPFVTGVGPAGLLSNWEARRSRAAPQPCSAPLSEFSINRALLNTDHSGPPWKDSCGPPGSGSNGPAVEVVNPPVLPAASKSG